MTKKTAFLTVLSLCTFTTFAQLTFSPVLAANYSKAKVNKDDFRTSRTFRYTLGVQPVYHFSEKTAIGLGIQLTTKGYKDGAGVYSLGEESQFQYLEANPFFEYRPFKFLGIIAGGNIGFLNSIQSKYGGKWQKPVNNPIFFEKWNVELNGGLRYYCGEAFVSFLFSQSILPILELYFSDENGNPISSLKQYHQSLSLGIGYNFHLKKK